MFGGEFCFEGYDQRTPQDHPYSYDPYFLKGSRASIKGAQQAYSDRLRSWHSAEAFEAAKAECGIEGHGDYWWRSAGLAQMSAFLTKLTGKDCKCVGIGEGCNVSNGYPYWIVWWKNG